MNFTNGLTDDNSLLKKLSLVICGLLENLSVIILLMDLLTAKGCKKKKFIHFILSVFPSVIFFVHQCSPK
jgi:uncharacterized membrane protein